jgi:hypothetical protein
MLKKNLTSLVALALVALVVPTVALAGDDVDIANDNLLYSVSPADVAAEGAALNYNTAFGDVYDDSVLFTQEDRNAEGAGALGSVDYTESGAWEISCDNYL